MRGGENATSCAECFLFVDPVSFITSVESRQITIEHTSASDEFLFEGDFMTRAWEHLDYLTLGLQVNLWFEVWVHLLHIQEGILSTCLLGPLNLKPNWPYCQPIGSSYFVQLYKTFCRDTDEPGGPASGSPWRHTLALLWSTVVTKCCISS